MEGAIIFVGHVGDYRVNEAKQILAWITDAYDRFGSAYLLVDLKEIGEVEPDVRKMVVECFRDMRFEALVLCGASFPTRVIAKMTAAALKVVRRVELPFIFVGSVKEGRAWIADHRRTSAAGRPRT